MRLRAKTLLAVASVVAVLIAVLATLIWNVVSRGVLGEEELDAVHHAERVRVAYEEEARGVESRISDWAIWDDAYEYVLKPDPEFAKSSLAEASIATMNIELFAFLNRQDSVVFSRVLAPDGRRVGRIPAEVEAQVVAGRLSVRGAAGAAPVTGLTVAFGRPMLVSGRPVLRSDESGPPAGVLLAGRWLDSVATRHWSRLAGVDVALLGAEATGRLPAGEQRALARAAGRGATPLFRGPDSLVAYVRLLDLDGRDVGLLRASSGRELFASARRSARAFLAAFVGVGLAFGALVVLLLGAFVLDPLGRLSREVRMIGRGRDARARVTEYGQDELGLLARDINATFDALRSSEARLTNAMEIARLGYWEYDVPSDTFTFNDQFYRLFRTTAEKVGGYKMRSAEYARQFVHPEDMAMVGEEVRQAIEATDPNYSRQLEHRIIYADKSVGHISVRFFIEKDSQGRTVRTFGANQDITDRRRAEEALRESEERYRGLFNQNLAAVYRSTLDGRLLECNEALVRMLGFESRESALATPTAELYFEQGDRSAFVARLERARALTDLESRLRRRDGSELVVLESVLLTSDPATKQPVIQGTMVDISARRRAEDALRAVSERRERLENIVNRSPAIAFLWRAGRELAVDFASTNVRELGYSSADFLTGRLTYADIVHPDDRDRAVDEAAAHVAAGRSEFVQQYRIVTATGAVRWIEDRTWVPRRPDGAITHHQGIVVDITERKRAEAELGQKNAELVQLNEVKNQLLGMAAHDLRNPLSVIQTASGFLLDDAARNLPEAKRLDFLRRMKTNSDFMVRLIDDLLDVAQIESGRLELDRSDVDLGAMIDDCLGLNAVLAEKKRIRLSGERAGALPRLQLDRGKIEQVLNNFVSNAIKFSQPDTDVLIRVGVRGDDVVVAVQDHGQGIPEAELDKLFKPFSRTSVRSTAGEKSTGLGLAIARKIVEGHGGRIWAESAAGKGSAFCFSLPMNSARQGGSAA